MPEHDDGIRGADADGIATAVREFYERHPYPGRVDKLDGYRARTDDDRLRLAEHHLYWPGTAYRDDPSVLIAGCGTVQAAKHAVRWPRARVVGIDVSEASIRQTQVLKDRYDIDNLELRHLPVERAEALGAGFDQVVCTGVLHHLPDPDAGLRALRGVLAPGGAIHLMVYAPHGRAGVYLLQDYCRRLGIAATPDGIRDLEATLRTLPSGHPVWPLLQGSPDFRHDAGLADALLHPRDRPYSVPQFLEFVARNGLRFGRWMRQAPYLPHCGAAADTPHHARLVQLPAEAQYAAMELFRGTMVRHSAIAYRDDEPEDGHAIGFDGDGWLDYVPVRLPETVCVEERLPPAAAGVLVNRSHADTDLYLPIDAAEKRLFEAIDGRRRIRDLVRGDVDLQSVRRFFERLWWYDQVAFDASRREAPGA